MPKYSNNCKFTPKDFGAFGDGVKNDTLSLQNSIHHAIQNKKILDLCGKTYRVDGTLIIKDDITIENGEILTVGNPNGTAIIAHKPADEYITIVVRDLIVRANGGVDKVGFNLVLGKRCIFENCTFVNFWNGPKHYSRGMLLEGCVGCSFIHCDWKRNDVLLEIHGKQREFEDEGVILPTTDTKFWSCRFQKSKTASIVLSKNTHNNAWHGCWIEHSVKGPLVEIIDSSYNSFHDCRLEDPGETDDNPTVAFPTVIIRKKDTGNTRACNSNRIISCIFSNTGNAGAIPLINLDGSDFNPDFPTVLMANHFPTSSIGAIIEGSDSYRSIANSILPDK